MKTKLKGISYSKYGYLFSIPFVVAFLIFTLYPTIYTAILGFTNCRGVNNTEFQFLEHPLENYKLILQNDSFRVSLKNTVMIWIMNFIPQITIALLLTAWFTSHSNEIKGKGFFKVVFYMPNIITAATVAILFHSLFNSPQLFSCIGFHFFYPVLCFVPYCSSLFPVVRLLLQEFLPAGSDLRLQFVIFFSSKPDVCRLSFFICVSV